MSFKTPKQILVDLANRSQRVPGTWTVDHIEFTEPAPFAGNRNTVIGLSPTPASPVQFTPAHSFYDRVDISSKFMGTLTWEEAPIDATPEQVLAEIESRHPIKVAGTEDQLPLDITHFNVLGEVGGSAYVFTAKPESLLYIGQFAVRLGVTEVPVEPEPEPGHDLRMIINPPNYGRGIILPSFHAAGYMLAHPNAPVRQTAMGFNGELQIAGTVFDENREKIYTPNNQNVFSVPFDEIATHWNWGLHIALADITNGTRIDELYDISVTLANVDTGQSAHYTFRYLTEEEDYGYVGYAIVNNEDNSPYVNFGFDEEHVSGRYAQMVLPAPTMRQVIPTDKAIDGVPFGRYYVEVIAQRKEGDVAPMVVSWMADIGRPIDDTSVLFEEPAYGTDPVKESFLKPDGNLLTGSGSPATDLVTADNGEVQMFGGVRYYRDPVTFAPDADNRYSLDIGTDRDWNFPFQIGLYDTRNATTLTDLYDVTFTIQDVNQPEASLNFVLNRRDGAYFLEDDTHSLSIVDGYADVDGTVYQEIQRLTFYVAEMYGENAPVNNAGAPFSEFLFTLTAARKTGGVEPLVLTWSAVVEGSITGPVPAPEETPTDPEEVVPPTEGGDGSSEPETELPPAEGGEPDPIDPPVEGGDDTADPEIVDPPAEGGDVVTDPETTEPPVEGNGDEPTEPEVTEPPVEGGDEPTEPETTEPPAEGDNSEVPPPTTPEEIPDDV